MEGTSTSTSRIHASDLNGPIDSSAVPADDVHEDRRERRASPSYDAAAAQGRQQSNGNSNWRRLTPERPLGRHDDGHSQGRSERQYDSRPQRSNYGGNRAAGGNADFFASRQAERDASNLSIWPPSPKTPRSEESEDERERRKRKKDKKHKSHKSSHSHKKKKRYSSETESDSEDDDRHRKSKKRRSSKHRHSDDMSDSEYERERRRRKEKKRSSKHRHDSRSRSRSRSRTTERIHNDQEDEWAEKDAPRSTRESVPITSLVPSTAGADKSGLTNSKGKGKESDSDSDDVGPKPLAETTDKHNPKDFGGALLKGEGAAMAAYVAEGARIPRRGEIGLESEQIQKFEDAGYVMSGSRHRRMNAVRMRKENQVITAEEKRQLLKTQKEEQDKKETMVVSSFKELLEQRLQGEKRKQRDNY